MRKELQEAFLRANYPRGHAFTQPPKPITRKKVMCSYCSGNGIARRICVICAIGLCKKHTFEVDGKTYCKEHKPGYVV